GRGWRNVWYVATEVVPLTAPGLHPRPNRSSTTAPSRASPRYPPAPFRHLRPVRGATSVAPSQSFHPPPRQGHHLGGNLFLITQTSEWIEGLQTNPSIDLFRGN
ncbi:hypothetical protein, partial [Fibrella arboris]|uniref:hypothetical protein n=1 Tax=Fibrella arboris TaxID=3242486 RepID=UPI00351FF46E